MGATHAPEREGALGEPLLHGRPLGVGHAVIAQGQEREELLGRLAGLLLLVEDAAVRLVPVDEEAGAVEPRGTALPQGLPGLGRLLGRL